MRRIPFPPSVPNLKQLYKRYGARKIHEWKTFVISRHENSDPQRRTRTLTARTQFKLKHMPSFIHTRKANKKDTDAVVLRNPLLAQAYYELDRRGIDQMQKLEQSSINIDALRKQTQAKLLS